MLTSSDIDKLSVVQEPIRGYAGHTYTRIKRSHEFTAEAVRTLLEYWTEQTIKDPEFAGDGDFEDFLYQLEFSEENFVICPYLELILVLECREKAEEITQNMNEILDNLDGRGTVGFDLNSIQSEIIRDLRATYKKNFPQK